MADYDVSSLIDDSANPLKAAGIDPSEATKNPAAVMAYLQNRQYGAGMNKPSSLQDDSYTPPSSAAPMASAAPAPTAATDWGAVATGRPSPSMQPAASAAGANVSNGDTDPDLSNARKLAQASQAATETTGKNWETSIAQQKALEAQRVQAAQRIDPRGDSNTTGQSYKPSVGRQILRGLTGAATGLVTGGIPGAVLGAIHPDKTAGGQGYNAPTAQYGRDVAAQQARVGSDDQQLAQMKEQDKAQYDAGRNLATDTTATAKTFGDIAAQQRAANQAKLDSDRNAAALAKGDETTRHNNATEATAQQRTDIADRNATNQSRRTDAILAKLAAGGTDTTNARQAIVDTANDTMTSLTQGYEFNPKTNTYDAVNLAATKPGEESLTPQVYTSKKQAIVDKANRSMKKGMAPMVARFNPADAGANTAPAPGGGTPPAAAPAKPAKRASGTVIGDAPKNVPEGSTSTLQDGSNVTIKNGKVVIL